MKSKEGCRKQLAVGDWAANKHGFVLCSSCEKKAKMMSGVMVDIYRAGILKIPFKCGDLA